MVFDALNPRNRSLPRGTALVLGSLVLAFSLAGFPEDRASLKLIIPSVARCSRHLGHHPLPATHRWSLYHGAVVVLIYMDIMALCMILFLLLYPVRAMAVVAGLIGSQVC